MWVTQILKNESVYFTIKKTGNLLRHIHELYVYLLCTCELHVYLLFENIYCSSYIKYLLSFLLSVIYLPFWLFRCYFFLNLIIMFKELIFRVMWVMDFYVRIIFLIYPNTTESRLLCMFLEWMALSPLLDVWEGPRCSWWPTSHGHFHVSGLDLQVWGGGSKGLCVLQLPVGFTGILYTDVGSSLTSISTLYESTLYPNSPILDIVT